MTQFGRALSELNIEILCANTSQAKGRVERAHHTLQDRLVKELRLAGISTIEAANAFLPAFVQTSNGRFAKPAASERDLHRSIAGINDLDDILCWREQRSVSHQLGVNYNRMKFMLRPDETSAALAGKVVDIYDFPRWPAGDPMEGTTLALLCLRPFAACQPRGHRREQASRRGAGLDQAATGSAVASQRLGRSPPIEPESRPDEGAGRSPRSSHKITNPTRPPGPSPLRC
jgi:hypothetical protein